MTNSASSTFPSTPAARRRAGTAASRPVGMLRRLDADWAAIARRPSHVRRARAWSLGVEFADLDDLLRLVGFRERPVSPGAVADAGPQASDGTDGDAQRAADSLLGRLLVVARTDELAARVVLQRLLPGLCAAARRWSGDRRGGSSDALDEIVSSAWLVIRAFPVERRSGNLAAKLLRDAEHQAFVKATRRRWTSEAMEPSSFERHVADTGCAEPADELADAVDLARPLLTEHDVLLLRLLVSGRSMPEVAALLDVSVRTVGYRREALVHRMRAAQVA